MPDGGGWRQVQAVERLFKRHLGDEPEFCLRFGALRADGAVDGGADSIEQLQDRLEADGQSASTLTVLALVLVTDGLEENRADIDLRGGGGSYVQVAERHERLAEALRAGVADGSIPGSSL